MSKIHLTIPIPAIIERIFVYFLLRCRKKHYGYPFRRIKLTYGKYAIVDPEDYDKVARYDWQLFESGSNNYYAIRFNGRRIVKMHGEILYAPAGKIIDHICGDGLDNRKANLRIATTAQNQYNRRKTTKKTTSKYKGVHLRKEMNKYCAAITYNGKRVHLGYFRNEIDAAKAYDKAARQLYGEFARLNFAADKPAGGIL